VFAEPELQYRQLGPNDAFLVIASDGVFEFLPSQSVVNMVRGGGGQGGGGGGACDARHSHFCVAHTSLLSVCVFLHV
jgi:serine/threonine protein phosphatase PrpC